MNQALYTEPEQRFSARMARLQAQYDEKVKQLTALAESKGILADFGGVLLLEE